MPRRRKTKRTLRPRTPSRIRKKKRKGARGHQHSELTGLALVAVGLFLATLLWLGWNGGSAGSWIADAVLGLLGAAAYAAPLVLLVLGVLMLGRSELVDLSPFRTGLIALVLGLGLVRGHAHGGLWGRGLDGIFATLLGSTGALILGVFALVAGVLLLTGASIGALLRRSGRAVKQARTAAQRRLERPALAVVPEPAVAAALVPKHEAVIDGVHDYPDVVGEAEVLEPPPLLLDPDSSSEEQQSLFEPVRASHDYRLPDRTILRHSPPTNGSSAEASARVAEALVSTLKSFGVEAHVVGQIAGPRVTRYELQLAPGTKVSKVAGLKDDLSYALATTEIRILAPIPGKQAVGVELPNSSPSYVALGDIFDDLPQTASPLSVWLGKDISGSAVWTDLARMPHVLIAGTTGSGKSGCINTILTSILLRSTPDDVRFILIDPKKIELSYYESIPHLLTPVVSNPKHAAAVLQNVVAEMEQRYAKLAILKARNIQEANRALRGRGEQPLPYLLVVIDELADLMMTTPQAVEDAIIRLAQKSRAVGIHLVLATQRPSVDVITGMIKTNVPSRIAFAVSSQTDSRVILDSGGAESLLGQGDMLFKPLGTSRLQRVQGAYVSEEEIALVVEQTRQREQELDESYLELPEVFAE